MPRAFSSFFFFLSFFWSFLPPLNYVSGLLNKKGGGKKGVNKSCLSLALHGGFAHQGRLACAITTGENSIFGRRRAHSGREIMTLLANQIRACCSVGLNEEWHRLAAVWRQTRVCQAPWWIHGESKYNGTVGKLLSPASPVSWWILCRLLILNKVRTWDFFVLLLLLLLSFF